MHFTFFTTLAFLAVVRITQPLRWRVIRVCRGMLRVSIIGLTALTTSTALFSLSGNAAAQGIVTWGEPFNVSSSETLSIHPAIVADAYGNIHVFWCEYIGEQDAALGAATDRPNTIFYRRWDGQFWTQPLDILAVRDDQLADFIAATIDNENQLHLVWTGLTDIFYSTAPAADASAVRAWSTPQVITTNSARTAYESDVVVDTQGTVHIVYAVGGSNPGVLHTRLLSDSAFWTPPVRIAGGLRDNEVAFKEVRLVIDALDRLHTTWSTTNNNAFGRAVYYAGSNAFGKVWSPPALLADATTDTGFTGYPYLLAYGRDDLLLIHVDQENKGRIERTSTDAGKTWSEPRFVLLNMEGVNGFCIPLLDHSGGLHLVINLRPRANQLTGIYYAPREGLDWSPVVPVGVDEFCCSSAHYADAVIRMGNEIHAVWSQIGSREVWHVRGTINGLAPLPAPTASSEPVPLGTAAQTPNILTTVTIEPSFTPEDAVHMPPEDAAIASNQTAPWVSIVVAIIPVVLLVSGVVIWQVRKR
ncbi:MAG: hypothetical protein JXA33_16745 [Anaerolineae bacterium]|nr:hypothetical protein [Anaerolineae bacterium]